HGGMAKQERKGRGGGARRGRGRWTFGAGIAAVVVIALIVGWFAYRAQADLPGQKFADQGNLHVQTLGDPHEPYNSTPPTSRPHVSPLAPPPYRAEIGAGYDVTWMALVRALAKQNLPLRAIARDSGVIATDDVVTPIGVYSDCGRTGDEQLEGEALVTFTMF